MGDSGAVGVATPEGGRAVWHDRYALLLAAGPCSLVALVVCQVSIEGFTVAETTQGVEHDAPTDDGAHSSDHG